MLSIIMWAALIAAGLFLILAIVFVLGLFALSQDPADH